MDTGFFFFYAVMSGFLVAFSLKKRAIECGLKKKAKSFTVSKEWCAQQFCLRFCL